MKNGEQDENYKTMSILSPVAISPLRAFRKGISWNAYWTTQYQAVYNAFTTKPDDWRRTQQARMVKTLVDGGVWDKLDIFQFRATTTNDSGEGLLNWKSPGTCDATLAGTTHPTFITNVGFQGDIANGAYINTNYNPTTFNGKYKQNDACYGVYYQTNNDESSRYGVHSGAIRCYSILRNSGTAYGNINQSSGEGGVVNAYSNGFFILNRTAADSAKFIRNNTLLKSITTASAGLPNHDFYDLAMNNGGTAANFSARISSLFFAGGSLTDDEIKILYSAVETYIYYATDTDQYHLPLMIAPDAKCQHGFEACGGKLYAMGGSRNITVNEYDVIKNQWTQKTSLPHGGAQVQSMGLRCVGNKLYFISGVNTSTETYYANVYEYDPVADTYTAKTNIPTPREDFGTAVVNGKIYCFGGIAATGRTKVLEIYDVANDSWSTGADLPDYKQLGDFGCAVNGKIYAIGASDLIYTSAPQVVAPVKSVYMYDPDTDTWTQKADIPIGTVYNERAVIGNYIYVVGGVPAGPSDELATYIKDIYRYDTINDTWSKVVDAPYGLHGAALAELNGYIYMVGGGRNSTETSDTLKFYRLRL